MAIYRGQHGDVHAHFQDVVDLLESLTFDAVVSRARETTGVRCLSLAERRGFNRSWRVERSGQERDAAPDQPLANS